MSLHSYVQIKKNYPTNYCSLQYHYTVRPTVIVVIRSHIVFINLIASNVMKIYYCGISAQKIITSQSNVHFEQFHTQHPTKVVLLINS